MTYEAAVVFTAKSVERILREGGTSSWRLDRNHARQCAYAICTRNAHADWVEGPEEHQAAFLIGKVKDVVPTPDPTETRKRFLIQFSEYARVDIPDVWQGDRNPVKYATLEELGIDSSTLTWEPMPEPDLTPKSTPEVITFSVNTLSADTPLTMAQAKKGLALTFGVSPEAIEITVRG